MMMISDDNDVANEIDNNNEHDDVVDDNDIGDDIDQW